MPPTPRRSDRAPAAGPANRSRMYNLAGHAHSSGSLLPRSTDVHAASTSTASPSAAGMSGGVDAADAPYLTNLEAHFGRVTLTAPDNLLRKQAKERKQKIRQRKAQNAQAAAAALAGATQTTLTSSAGRNAMASSSNLLDSTRRYQTTLGEQPVSTGLLLPPPDQHMGMRRAYSGGHTPTLASTVNAHPAPSSTTQTVVARTRRRRPSSAARDDASRPASRASGISRPDSDEAELDQPLASTSAAAQRLTDDSTSRSRTESAPATQRRSHNAFDTSRSAAEPENTAPMAVVPSEPTAPTSMHRQNVWNDITEADPDDLPPPFPVGAPRPPTPPLPPTHSEAANDAQLIGPQPHARIPDSPPPAFVSDDEDEVVSLISEQSSRAQSPAPPPTDQPQPESVAEQGPNGSRRISRASSSSSASASDDESIELTQERRAWEADIQNGLSFEVRLLREQQRRVARERAVALRAAERDQEVAAQAAATEIEEESTAAEPAPRGVQAPTQSSTAPVEAESAPTVETLPVSSAEALQSDRTTTDAVLPSITDRAHALDPAPTVPIIEASQIREAEVTPQVEVATSQPTVSASTDQAVASVQPSEAGNFGSIAVVPTLASTPQTASATAINRATDTAGRLMLANETRLGLPAVSASSRPSSGFKAGTSTATSISQPSTSIPLQVSAHKPPDPLKAPQSSSARASVSARPVRPPSQAFARQPSRPHFPPNRRPEDTLYVISAPPAAAPGSPSNDDEAASREPNGALADAASNGQAVSDDDDEGAESDSSIEQWLAESAAFDALRKREEEAAARLQALQEPPFSDSDAEDDAIMPGAFDPRPSPRVRQASGARKVPDPARLVLMDRELPKAPPPLVLGRSRGGAAYSDSSSESTDTDDALDQYSSSDEDDEQHRAFHDARALQAAANDPFVNAHKSVHARNTSSAPNLAILDTAEEDLAKVRPAEGTVAPQLEVRQQLVRKANIDLVSASTGKLHEAPTQGPTRRLSQKAKGKLPARVAEPDSATQPAQRAGDFEEDTSSSRDLDSSDVEETAAPTKHVSASIQSSTQLGRSNSSGHRDSSSSHVRPGSSLPRPVEQAQAGARRSSLDPLLQPLGPSSLNPLFQPLAYGDSGRTELRDRIKGLFGQPLVDGPASQPSARLSANVSVPSTPATQTSSTPTQPTQFMSDARRVSNNSRQLAKPPTAMETRRNTASVDTTHEELPSLTAATKRDDSTSIAPSRGPSQSAQPDVRSRPIGGKGATSEANHSRSAASALPEQRARDEALLQIAQLAASTQSKQDSLAALERLLARTARPVSMMPPSTVTRAELGGHLQPKSGVAAAQEGNDAVSAANETSSARAAALASNRLSRQGAIVRNRGPLPDPPSALARATSSASRPVSFVNPRSSAAPMPRGRLPPITDATRHFPPSASNTGPGVAPSWLSYIPSEERERLPAPLEPQRVNSLAASRAPGSRVSAMISRFEAPTSSDDDQRATQAPSSPPKQSGPLAGIRESGDADHVIFNHSTDRVEVSRSASEEEKAERAVFRRFSRVDGPVSPEQLNATQRRRPPPPPTLPARRPSSNLPQHADPSERPASTADDLTQSSSMDALARQIEEAAAGWSAASLHDHSPGMQQRPTSSGSRLTVPTLVSTSASAGSDVPLRSPRTQAMHTLTRREHDAGTTTPPNLPPKSPLMTPEQILASGSRSSLSASIAAAQAAAFARRDGRGSRSHSASSSMDTTYRGATVTSPDRQLAGRKGSRDGAATSPLASRPLPTLPAALRTSSSHGLGISAESETRDAVGASHGELPMPPPLPVRPRYRDWGNLGNGAETASAQEPLPPSPARQPPSLHRSGSGMSSRTTSARDENGRQQRAAPESLPSNGNASPAPEASISLRSSPSPAATPSTAPINLPQLPAEPSSSLSGAAPSAPRREASLGLTDFDLLVAQLERDGSHFESLSAIGEFLGPAKPTAATPAQLASLSVGLIECDSRRVTKEGKIKQKLSCVGVRVDKCAICMAQFKESQRAVLLPCGHIFHEECAVRLLKRITTCPTCRAPAV
ncbi:Zinc finger, RING-type [Kalmanozyma brasiliensis GHG001]|uniref:Zinc finger, RING-type n=1 Tax=Kalmanozyma brasiliensis (strain GHG001) TaxID=1365824 RepID=UPI002868166D|nr:Zinc finger, RING-type [Kalmanozyma brasiliensis GHG001]KAF6767573.1 Zinc finger, RING-type [Kalmanozyma brasiliensis GHG001]